MIISHWLRRFSCRPSSRTPLRTFVRRRRGLHRLETRVALERLEDRTLLSNVVFDPGAYVGQYAVSGETSVLQGLSTVDLDPGTYQMAVTNGTGTSFSFTVDAAGDVTSLNTAAAVGSGNTLTFNNSTLVFDPVAFPGSYTLLGVVGGISGLQSQVVIPGLNDYDLAIANAGTKVVKFNVDAAGNVTSLNTAAVSSSGNTLTFNNKTVTIDPDAYTGSYGLLSVAGGISGVQSHVVVPGLNGYDLAIANAGAKLVKFNVDAAGNVTSLNTAAVSSSGNTLTLNNKTVTIDPDAYTGSYSLLSVAGGISGVQSHVVVPGLNGYDLAVGSAGIFKFSVDSSGVPTPETIPVTVDGDDFVFTLCADACDEPISLRGAIFDDVDNDGVFEPGDGDVGLIGVTVNLTGTDDLGAVIRSTLTLAGGTYAFDEVRPGSYTLTGDQPSGLLDGIETAGSLGGTVDNTQDSNSITDITVVNGDSDATGYHFAEFQPSEALGLAWQDVNNDGEVNFGEQAVEGLTINLDGTDDRGNAVSRSVQTDTNGIYMFIDLRPGDYTISEVQPVSLNDGLDVVGTVNGVPVGDNSVNDTISSVVLPLPGSVAENYNFGERPLAGGEVDAGQTATIGFWQNNNGQALIAELNGGATATELGDWLAATFPNMYGTNAGANNLTGFTNAEVGDFYSDLFRRKKKEAEQLGLGGPAKTDAQVLATALAVYVTNSTLAGTTAESYGFVVTENGVGVSTFNVGDNGDAFDVADGSEVSILDLLLATNDKAINGILYDLDGDGDADDSLETLLRTMANDVYSAINEQGDI